MKRIQSKENLRYKEWRKLLKKKGRQESGRLLAEGEHLVAEALAASCAVVSLLFCEGYAQLDKWLGIAHQKGIETFLLPSHLFRKLTETDSPQGVMAVVEQPVFSPLEEYLQQGKLLVLVDRVQDPGNLGTILRTSAAAGVDAALLAPGTADPLAGKVVRATQGAFFHLPLFQTDLGPVIGKLKSNGWRVVSTALNGAVDMRELQLHTGERAALLVGNEAQGVHPDLQRLADVQVKIPLFGPVESLNVSVASGILLYHLRCQMED